MLDKLEKYEILYIEDDPEDVRILKRVLDKGGLDFELHSAPSGREGLKLAEEGEFDLIFLDQELGDTKGAELIPMLSNGHEDTPIILITGLGDERLARDVLKQGATDYWLKTDLLELKPELFRREIEHCIERARLDSERRRLEEESRFLRKLVITNHESVVVIDYTGRIIYVNPAFCRLTGMSEDELHGTDPDTLFQSRVADSPRPFEKFASSHPGMDSWEGEVYRLDKNGRYEISLQLSIWPMDAPGHPQKRVVGILRDITNLKKLKELLVERNRFIENTFNSIGEAILVRDGDNRILDLNRTAQTLLGINRDRSIGNPAQEILAEGGYDTSWMDCLPCGEPDGEAAPTFQQFHEPTDRWLEVDCFHAISAQTGESTYTIDVLRDITERKKMQHELVERDRERTAHIKLSREYQFNLVPMHFAHNKLKIETCLISSGELSGDFCDMFSMGMRTMGFVIGDVSNKGISAAVKTFAFYYVFRSLAKTLVSPKDLMEEVNRYVYRLTEKDNWFVTTFFARVDTEDLVMTYTNAGHEYPILLRASDGKATEISNGNLVCGILPDTRYETFQLQLEEGDKLVFYTDGLCDMLDSEGRRLGRDRVAELLESVADKPAPEINKFLRGLIEENAGEAKPVDDILYSVWEVIPDPWETHVLTEVVNRELIADLCQRMDDLGVSEKLVFHVRLALDELLVNAFRHGNRMDPEKQVVLKIQLTEDFICVRIKDEGEGFNFEKIPDPTVEENIFKTHGRGIFIARQVTDYLEFNSLGNEVSFNKYFSSPEKAFALSEGRA